MDFFDSDGVRIAYVDRRPDRDDRGEPILLIHGFASNYQVNWEGTLWIDTLLRAGRRVIALDNRGHGQSEKLYRPADYTTGLMAEDARRLLDHLSVPSADIFGYSMGARITAFLTLAHPGRVRSAILGGLGSRLVDGGGLPIGIAEAMEAASADSLQDSMQRMFRMFAEATKSDRRALAACIRGSRQSLSEAEVARILCPVLVAVGGRDELAGDPGQLAELMPHGEAFVIGERNHNLAVGDKSFKQAVLTFLEKRP